MGATDLGALSLEFDVIQTEILLLTNRVTLTLSLFSFLAVTTSANEQVKIDALLHLAEYLAVGCRK